MENERIKTALNKLLDEVEKNSLIYHGSIKSIRKELNQGKEPQGYQGLNKWYKSKHEYVFYAVNDVFSDKCAVSGYGYNKRYSVWEDIVCLKNHTTCLATPSEIQSTILKGCEQKGIVKGAVCRWENGQNLHVTFEDIYYSQNSNKLYQNFNKEFPFAARCLFDNGKFAEVVKEQNFKCETGNCKEQCNKCESSYLKEFTETKPSDKELLKECLDYINSLSKARIKAKALSIKLNKHLNHE